MDSLRVVSGLPHYTTTAMKIKSSRPVLKAPSKTKSTRSFAKPRATASPDVERMAHETCGLVDPFCEHAVGAKYPDDSSARTLPYTVRYMQTYNSFADGTLGVFITPNTEYDSIGASIAPSSAPYMKQPVALATAPVPTFAGADRFRIVSVGVRVTSIAPSLTASGMLHFRSHAVENGNALCTHLGSEVNGTSFAASKAADIALDDCKGYCFILEHSAKNPQLFYSPAQVTTNGIIDMFGGFAGFYPGTIYGNGLPANTPCIQVEFIMHLEYIFDASDALNLAATPGPRFNPVVRDAATTLTSLGNHIFSTSAEKIGAYIEKKAIETLRSFMSSSAVGRGMLALTAI
jgi:hypothetical protein